MITYTGSQRLLSWFAGKTTGGNTLYAGLSSTPPTIAGANVTEPRVNSYRRVLIASGSSSGTNVFGTLVNTTDGSYVTNSSQIYFPETYNTASEVVEDWGELGWICLFGSSSGSDLLAYDELPNKIHPGGNGESTIPIIRVGDAKITIGNAANQEETTAE